MSLQIQAQIELERRRRERSNPFPTTWATWLPFMFPVLFNHPFAAHHVEFWNWIDAIAGLAKPRPFIAVWPRGGAKTTAVEAAVVRMAALQTRKFCLYVRSTQDKANESVSNIAAMFESRNISHYYPQLSERKLSKYGFARGWRVDMLRCASGFSVIGLGLDAAVRGIKIEEQRPDIIAFDDLDDVNDTAAVVARKTRVLTSSILPAGATNVAIIGVQNLVHNQSIFYNLVHQQADFLLDRYVSGPYPAIYNFTYARDDTGKYIITGGEATWEGQSLDICQHQINDWGLSAFLREAQHDVEISGGIWQHIEFRQCAVTAVPELVRGGVWLDPAVTSTDASDCQAIQVDALGVDGLLYRLYSWEGIASPEEAVLRAIVKCLEYGLDSVGIETDQGGDTWRSVYAVVWQRVTAAVMWHARLLSDPADAEAEAWLAVHPELALVAPLVPLLERGPLRQPTFTSAKAGQGHGSKIARNQRMLVSYEQGRVVHVQGTHATLEQALRRFPNKPLDLADAAYWGWWDLLDSKGAGGSVGRLTDRTRSALPTATPLPQYLTLRYRGERRFPLTIGATTYMIEAGWQRQIERQIAEQIVTQFSDHFEVVA